MQSPYEPPKSQPEKVREEEPEETKKSVLYTPTTLSHKAIFYFLALIIVGILTYLRST